MEKLGLKFKLFAEVDVEDEDEPSSGFDLDSEGPYVPQDYGFRSAPTPTPITS